MWFGFYSAATIHKRKHKHRHMHVQHSLIMLHSILNWLLCKSLRNNSRPHFSGIPMRKHTAYIWTKGMQATLFLSFSLSLSPSFSSFYQSLSLSKLASNLNENWRWKKNSDGNGKTVHNSMVANGQPFANYRSHSLDAADRVIYLKIAYEVRNQTELLIRLCGFFYWVNRSFHNAEYDVCCDFKIIYVIHACLPAGLVICWEQAWNGSDDIQTSSI